MVPSSRTDDRGRPGILHDKPCGASLIACALPTLKRLKTSSTSCGVRSKPSCCRRVLSALRPLCLPITMPAHKHSSSAHKRSLIWHSWGQCLTACIASITCCVHPMRHLSWHVLRSSMACAAQHTACCTLATTHTCMCKCAPPLQSLAACACCCVATGLLLGAPSIAYLLRTCILWVSLQPDGLRGHDLIRLPAENTCQSMDDSI
jgi:hypothetical protein